MAKAGSIDVPVNVTFTTGGGGVTIHEPPPPIALPRFGEWPTFYGAPWMRNGREAGAYLAGCLDESERKCGHVVVTHEQEAGAIHALVESGYQVAAYSSNESSRTFEVRSIHHEFVDPE